MVGTEKAAGSFFGGKRFAILLTLNRERSHQGIASNFDDDPRVTYISQRFSIYAVNIFTKVRLTYCHYMSSVVMMNSNTQLHLNEGGF